MLHRASIVVGMVLVLSSAAESATLLSPPLIARTGSSVACVMANTGKTAREVTIEIVRGLGDVVESTTTTLEPGRSATATAEVWPQLGRCRFVVQGSARGFRATGCTIEAPHGCRGSVEAW
jgi:hypothetical protein